MGLAGVVALFGEFVYFRRFAYRIPDPKLARSTTILMWAVPCTVVLGILTGILGALLVGTGGATGAVSINTNTTAGGTTLTTMQTGTAGLGLFVGVLGCGGGILFFVFFIWYLRLLVRYKIAFEDAAEEARFANVVDQAKAEQESPETE